MKAPHIMLALGGLQICMSAKAGRHKIPRSGAGAICQSCDGLRRPGIHRRPVTDVLRDSCCFQLLDLDLSQILHIICYKFPTFDTSSVGRMDAPTKLHAVPPPDLDPQMQYRFVANLFHGILWRSGRAGTGTSSRVQPTSFGRVSRCKHLFKRVYVCVYMCICVDTHTYIYIYIYIHTRM